MKLSLCRRSPTLMQDGRWSTWLNGVRFRVRPLSNPAFQSRLAELRDPYRAQFAADPNSAENRKIDSELMRRAAAYLATDVDNAHDEDGKPIVFSHEWLETTLMDSDMEHLFAWLIATSAQDDGYTAAADQADAGNSVRRSAGT